MRDSLRENLSYFGLYKRMFKAKKITEAEEITFGADKEQHFLYYAPLNVKSDKILVWIHGGGWNAGSPEFFDFVGQRIAGEGYHCISLGYRLSPKSKYPCQIEDVCKGYNAAVQFLQEKGIDTAKIVVSGPSAGAHLASILCYSKKNEKLYNVDISNVIGFIGVGGPYLFSKEDSFSVKILLNQLFEKRYDRRLGEPYSLMEKSHIPMLLIQSEHDGLIKYSCAEKLYEKAMQIGNKCELYSVIDKKNTHSWYTAGMFLETRKENYGLDKFFSWIEAL